MGRVTCQITMSLDGYVAGPDQSLAEPLGVGGEELHTWMFGVEGVVHPVDARIVPEILAGNGAYVMGRNMFGGGPGGWDDSWRGWWGEDPPYHVPVFVLTHHPREPVEMQGGTTFHFVPDGIAAALDQARAAAGDRDVAIAGGAQCVRQYLAAGLLDELYLHVAPRLLGGGEKLFDGLPDLAVEPVEVQHSPYATHIRYRLG